MKKRQRICLLGATGTIGRVVRAALLERGHDVVCFVRTGTAGDGAAVRVVDFTDPHSLDRDGFAGEAFDALVSCMASRTGVPSDAWAIGIFPHWLLDDGGHAIIHLQDKEAEAGFGSIDHVALLCRDRVSIKARLDGMAIEYREVSVADGRVLLFLRDPHGVTLELGFRES